MDQLIPEENLNQILDKIKDVNSPEYNFISRVTKSILITNLLTIILLSI
jgi:DNA repair photolyase